MNQSTLFRSQRVRWITLALLLAAFAALLTTSFALAQSDSKTIMYAENGTGPVANLTATDPEDDSFTWTLSGGYDMEHFEIGKETGALSFKMPPDFEDPKDNGRNNAYIVEAMATDSNNKGSNTFTVTVEVTNVDEEGQLTWEVDGMDLMQFEVGAILVASLTDGDVPGSSKTPSPITWQWYRSSTMSSMGTLITGEATDTYTATSDDVGQYLHVKALYNIGGGDDETVSLTSEYPVLAARAGNNRPEFSSASVAREVDEGMKGMTVGDPVTAADDGPGKLNYALNGTDADKFAIDRKTGQITTTMDLDYEANDCGSNDQCTVEVTATDSAGASSAAATVNIKLKDVNEAPMFTQGPKTIQHMENTTALMVDGVAATYMARDPEGGNVNLSLTGRDAALFKLDSAGVLEFKAGPDFEKPADRNRDNVYEVTVRASDDTLHTDQMVMVNISNENEGPTIKGDETANYAENGSGSVLTLTATDPEGDTVMWSLLDNITDSPEIDGVAITNNDIADEADLTINQKGVLSFVTSPDYEVPADADTDNVYNIVVKAEASGMSYKKVVVTVTDVKEKGTVVFKVTDDAGNELRQFDVAVVLHADVEDGDVATADKDVASPTFVWSRSKSRTSSGTTIDGETGQTYTLDAADAGYYIHVVATYTVGTGDPETATGITEYTVAAARTDGTGDTVDNDDPPEFDPTTPKREVKEGMKGMRVGSPVTAKDDARRPLFYALSGTDVSKFNIDPKTGQITSTMELNYEADAGADDNCTAKNSCEVIVTATNSAGTDSTTTATVTITIKNVNEAPDFADGLKTAITLDENQTALNHSSGGATLAEVTYTATDPEGGNVTYRLMGPDSALFQLDSAQVLSFRAKPDYEMPADRNKDNIYEVTVRASDDSSQHTEHTVRIKIKGVNEGPAITGAEKVTTNAAPMFSAETTTRSVPENTEAGMDIGRPVAATDADGDTLTYTLTGDDAGSFSINASTGQLMTMAALDYETKMSYMVMVTATDPDGESHSIEVTINVTDVDENPLMTRYDTNGTPGIQLGELQNAIDDYYDGEINLTQLQQVINAYYDSTG